MRTTVGRLARRFGISRSTLLYYDRIGLLAASARSGSGYRLYTREDVARLEKVLLFRRVGLSLAAIGAILAAERGSVGEALERRLTTIDEEIASLRRQQQVILRLLERGQGQVRAGNLDQAGWVALLRATGLDDDDMRRWHVEFERVAPEAHQDFLESLGIAAEEIVAIRKRSV
jgi:MerR family transcriptional regulator, thiopeptide resistance regulator